MRHLIIFITILTLLAATIAIENFTNFDIWLQNHFFNFNTKIWLISYERHQQLNPIFYTGIKGLVATIGTICAIYLICCIKYKKLRTKFIPILVVLLSTILVPTLVGQLKKVTNTYCPAQLQNYNGPVPYVKLLQPYPKDFNYPHPGRCFPAGHVTGAFSLMALYLIFDDRRKYAALAFALTLGITASTYQMFRGEHFISHNLTSALLAALIIYLLNISLKTISTKYFHNKSNN